MLLERKLISPKRGSCMARGANWSALRTPDQLTTGCGGLHRSSPTGGAAKGIPLKLRSPESGYQITINYKGNQPGLIRFASLRRKARNDVAEVGTVERRVFIDRAREGALPKRTKWNEAASQFLQGR